MKLPCPCEAGSATCTGQLIDRASRSITCCAPTQAGAWPQAINLDGNTASHLALRKLGEEDPRWQGVVVRDRRYLNNIVEQDHRAIKSRCASMLGFKSFRTAAITLSGIELAHRIRKQQFSFANASDRAEASLKRCGIRRLLRLIQRIASRKRGLPIHQPLMHQNCTKGRSCDTAKAKRRHTVGVCGRGKGGD